ncbi:hypothetical protein TNCV_2795011 [Trichonephila clavipes]|nr:hypothetical protein TNCV_2795011 [Trichonephila clavipes]
MPSNAVKTMPRETVGIKERQENHFVSTVDFGQFWHVILMSQIPTPKGAAFSDPIKRKNFSSKWTKRGNALFKQRCCGEIPNQIPPKPKT